MERGKETLLGGIIHVAEPAEPALDKGDINQYKNISYL